MPNKIQAGGQTGLSSYSATTGLMHADHERHSNVGHMLAIRLVSWNHTAPAAFAHGQGVL